MSDHAATILKALAAVAILAALGAYVAIPQVRANVFGVLVRTGLVKPIPIDCIVP